MSYSWAHLLDVVLRTASALHAGGREHPVGVCARNAAEVVIVHTAAALAGTPVVPLSFHLPPAEIGYIARDADCRTLLTDGQTLEAVLTAKDLERLSVEIIGWRADRTLVQPFDSWIAGRPRHRPQWDAPPVPNVMYTSGTTGRPKGVVSPDLQAPTTLAESLVAGPHESGAHLVVGPLYHGGPIRGGRHLFAGAPVYVLDRFDAEAVLQAVQARRVASSTMVPTHFKRLLDLPAEVRRAYDVSSLRSVRHTGASCPPALKRAMISWWGPILYESYGGTEAGILCQINSEEWLAHPGSVGRPLPGISAKAIGEDGRDLPPGEIGILHFRYSTGLLPRSRGAAAAGTPPPRPDGYFTLGEVGYVDSDGYVFITDRSADLVLSGGVNVYPAEAERILLSDPRVADAACIGVPDDDMGERLIALVEPAPSTPNTPDASEATILAACRAQIGSVKSPKEIIFVRATGRGAMGKINRKALAVRFLAGQISPLPAAASSCPTAPSILSGAGCPVLHESGHGCHFRRCTDGKSLTAVASQIPHNPQLIVGLDAFGHNRQTQCVGQVDDSADDWHLPGVGGRPRQRSGQASQSRAGSAEGGQRRSSRSESHPGRRRHQETGWLAIRPWPRWRPPSAPVRSPRR